ncbi:MAG TPA: tetratricopeptide repeat protein [Solirubrobacteraceae bacterium]|nr:tetratricopeptide repeat protein [Solirubrobacteraceae bacterium]
MTVIDVDEADFDTAVVQRSAELPVVVDFWAPWCAPCRQLGPVLEKAAEARDGQVVLVKIDTDQNPGIAQQFGIQGIPAVKAFVDGEVAAEFVGAQGPTQVEAFFDALVPTAAKQLLDAGDEASLRQVLELEPTNADARLRLARMRYGAGDPDAALELLGNVAGSFAADGLAARIELEQQDGDNPRVAEAFSRLDADDPEAGLDILLDELAASDAAGEDRERLRKIIVAVLDELGVQHPLARESRRRLAAALY